MKKIHLASPHLLGNEKEYVQNALDSNWVAPLGKYVDKLEKDICDLVGCEAAVALSSGTAAIHLALIEAGVSAGDVVFCSDLTFTASANPIVYCGATPIFIDCDNETYNMSPVALEKAFELYSPKAVVVASIYGQPARLDEIEAICRQHDCIMIEDATEVLGATYNERYAGTVGKYGTFSFNGNKIITTSGGGILISNDKTSAKHALHIAMQAKLSSRYYEHCEIGFNYRLSNISAAIGVAQLEKLKEKIELKKAIYDRYDIALAQYKEYGICMLPVPDNRTSNYWLSILILGDDCSTTPEQIVDALGIENIEARHIWKPLHTQQTFKDSEFIAEHEGCSNSDYFFKHGVCLPSDTNMTAEEQQRVISIIKTVIYQNINRYYLQKS